VQQCWTAFINYSDTSVEVHETPLELFLAAYVELVCRANGISSPPSLESGIPRLDTHICGPHPPAWLSFPRLSSALLQLLRERCLLALTSSNFSASAMPSSSSSLASIWWLELAYLLARNHTHNRTALLCPPHNWHLHFLTALKTFTATALVPSRTSTVGAHRSRPLSSSAASSAATGAGNPGVSTSLTLLKLSYTFLILNEFCTSEVANVKESLVNQHLFDTLAHVFRLLTVQSETTHAHYTLHRLLLTLLCTILTKCEAAQRAFESSPLFKFLIDSLGWPADRVPRWGTDITTKLLVEAVLLSLQTLFSALAYRPNVKS
jgi:hypothetical protein